MQSVSQEKDKTREIVTVKIHYTDGIKKKAFFSKEDAEWFCRNEGDHVKNWEYV